MYRGEPGRPGGAGHLSHTIATPRHTSATDADTVLTPIKNKISVRNAREVKHCEQSHAANEESE